MKSAGRGHRRLGGWGLFALVNGCWLATLQEVFVWVWSWVVNEEIGPRRKRGLVAKLGAGLFIHRSTHLSKTWPGVPLSMRVGPVRGYSAG